MFSVGICLKIEDYVKGHYIFWQMIMELLIFMHISIIEKFLDEVSYLSSCMLILRTCTHIHTHTEWKFGTKFGCIYNDHTSPPLPSFGSVSVIILKAVAVQHLLFLYQSD
jgi:hypothetical protein